MDGMRVGTGTETQEGGDISIHLADFLHYIPETNMTLQSNYTPNKFKKKKKERQSVHWLWIRLSPGLLVQLLKLSDLTWILHWAWWRISEGEWAGWWIKWVTEWPSFRASCDSLNKCWIWQSMFWGATLLISLEGAYHLVGDMEYEQIQNEASTELDKRWKGRWPVRV